MKSPSREPVSLAQWVDENYRFTHDVRDTTLHNYRQSIRILSNWAGQALTTVTINDKLLNTILMQMVAAKKSPH